MKRRHLDPLHQRLLRNRKHPAPPPNLPEIPPNAVPADPELVQRTGWGEPIEYYEDIPFTCRTCRSAEVWKAQQQKVYQEIWRKSQYHQPILCRACRKARQAARAEQLRKSEAGRLAKLSQSTSSGTS